MAERLDGIELSRNILRDNNDDSSREEETDSEKEARFARYRLARAKKVNVFGDFIYTDVYDKITKEELDYYLKKRLQVPLEQRRYPHRTDEEIINRYEKELEERRKAGTLIEDNDDDNYHYH